MVVCAGTAEDGAEHNVFSGNFFHCAAAVEFGHDPVAHILESGAVLLRNRHGGFRGDGQGVDRGAEKGQGRGRFRGRLNL